jgi:hypothetical protein
VGEQPPWYPYGQQQGQSPYQGQMGDAGSTKPVEASEKNSKKRRLSKASKVLATLGALGTFTVTVILGHPLLTYASEIKNSVFPPSNQSIIGQATSWPMIYQDSFQPSSASSWYLYSSYAGVKSHATTQNNNLDLYLYSTKPNQGTLGFVADKATNLPSGNFYMSIQVQNESGCQFGLMFRASLNNTFAWFYVNEIGTPYFQVDVNGKNGLKSILHRKFSGTMGSIASMGIVQYGNKYVFEINSNAIGSVSSSTIQRWVGDPGLAGSMLGIGTCSCGSKAEYSFRDLAIRAPSE